MLRTRQKCAANFRQQIQRAPDGQTVRRLEVTDEPLLSI